MMIIDMVFEQMYCRFEGATDDKPRAEGKLAFIMPRCEGGRRLSMGFHCNRKATIQMTKR